MVQQLKTMKLSPLQTILAAAATAIAAGITSPLIVNEYRPPAISATKEEVQSLSNKLTDLQVKVAEGNISTQELKEDVWYMRARVDEILNKVSYKAPQGRGR